MSQEAIIANLVLLNGGACPSNRPTFLQELLLTNV